MNEGPKDLPVIARGPRLIVSSMRNEGPFILEWIAYHRHIGFDDFLIYSNDCQDGTDLILDRLQELGVLTHERNARQGKKTVQWQALSHASGHPKLAAADWVLVSDVDEYLTIHTGDGTLDDLFRAAPEADAFAISWRMFGNNGRIAHEQGLVTEQFIRCAPETIIWPWRAAQFKSLFRNGPGLKRLGVHAPRFDKAARGSWVDGCGVRIIAPGGTYLHNTGPRYGLAQINHYALGSAEGFLVKAARGRPNHSDEPIGVDYWIERNFNQIEDRRILRHSEAVKDGIAALLSDERLARLCGAAELWRKSRIATLKTEDPMFELYSAILHAAPTPLLPPDQQLSLLSQKLAIKQREAKAKSEDRDRRD